MGPPTSTPSSSLAILSVRSTIVQKYGKIEGCEESIEQLSYVACFYTSYTLLHRKEDAVFLLE